MTRLLMTCDAVGGVWQYATDLAGALIAHGIETTLAVLGPADTIGAAPAGVTVVETGLPLDWLASGPDEVAQAGDAVAALARDGGADLVQLNSPALAARTDFDIPTIAVAHGCLATWWQAARGERPDAAFAWHAKMMREGLMRATLAVAPSASFAATLRDTYDLPSTPVAVHNGRAPMPSPQGVAPTSGVFTAGRLWDEVKNTTLLDRVAAMLPVPFRAAGPLTAPRGETTALRHLHTLGRIDEAALAREFAAQPVFVSATGFEPFGLSVLEAAMAGCPLVLAGIDTFRELWTGAALLVPVQDPVAYRDAIMRVLGDDDLRAHLGAAARQRATRYTIAATAGAMAAIYDGVLAAIDRVAA